MFNRNLAAPLLNHRFGGRALAVALALALGGCVATPQKEPADAQVADAKLETSAPAPQQDQPDQGPTEVVEQHAADGSLRSRAEGWRDVDGNFVHHGKLIIFWDTGEKKTEVYYRDGEYHGPKTSWYRDGQIWNSGQSINGKPTGTWSEWHANGAKAREMTFVSGGLNGWMIEWYPDGQMKRRVMYVKGLRQGRETRWDIDGALLREADYLDDVMQP